jgi:GTP-binding protein Era
VHPGRRADRPGDRWIYQQIRDVAPRTTLVVIVTKTDKVPRDRVAAQLVAVSAEFGEHAGDRAGVGGHGEQLDVLIEVLAAQLPPGRRSTPTAS